jgi:hypothetical protein
MTNNQEYKRNAMGWTIKRPGGHVDWTPTRDYVRDEQTERAPMRLIPIAIRTSSSQV